MVIKIHDVPSFTDLLQHVYTVYMRTSSPSTGGKSTDIIDLGNLLGETLLACDTSSIHCHPSCFKIQRSHGQPSLPLKVAKL